MVPLMYTTSTHRHLKQMKLKIYRGKVSEHPSHCRYNLREKDSLYLRAHTVPLLSPTVDLGSHQFPSLQADKAMLSINILIFTMKSSIEFEH